MNFNQDLSTQTTTALSQDFDNTCQQVVEIIQDSSLSNDEKQAAVADLIVNPVTQD